MVETTCLLIGIPPAPSADSPWFSPGGSSRRDDGLGPATIGWVKGPGGENEIQLAAAGSPDWDLKDELSACPLMETLVSSKVQQPLGAHNIQNEAPNRVLDLPASNWHVGKVGIVWEDGQTAAVVAESGLNLRGQTKCASICSMQTDSRQTRSS